MTLASSRPLGAVASALTRREFLARTGWLSAGLTVMVSCSSWLPALPTRKLPEPADAEGWLQILADGRIRFFCPRSEMGQGIATGLAQVVAEELDLKRGEIEVVQPSTAEIAPAFMTVGSMSMHEFFEPTARAAARLREGLRSRAAEALRFDVAALGHRRGGFDAPDGRRIEFAALVSETPEILAAAVAPIPVYCLDEERESHSIGHPWAPLGAEQIVTGQEIYTRDVVISGMRFGSVSKPPRTGARLVSFDAAAVRAANPEVEVVVDRKRNRIGLVAASDLSLQAALRSLAPRWEGGDTFSQSELDARLDVDVALADDALEHEVHREGDLDQARESATRELDARYSAPMTAHAAMEPRSAVASVRNDGVEVFAASQDPWLMRSVIASEIGCSAKDVVLHNHRMGGAFGGRTLCQAAVEAAWLSSETRSPVRVQWSREEEFAYNSVGPPFSHRIHAGLDERGRIAYWDHAMVSCPIMFSSAVITAGMHWLLDIPKDPGTMRSARPPYTLPSLRLRFSDIRIPIVTGAWRGLGATPNTFAVESAMDELSGLAGADPLTFRLTHVPAENPRLANVLEHVRRLSRWRDPLPQGSGRGVAATVYKDATYVAVVAEVSRTNSAAGFRIDRVFCVHDCGRVISPGQVRAQIEGNLAWGCGLALAEQMSVADGAPSALNFDRYRVLRMSEMPQVEIELVASSEHPSGAGEAAFAPTPAAIANALSSLTGRRLRSLPLRLPQ